MSTKKKQMINKFYLKKYDNKIVVLYENKEVTHFDTTSMDYVIGWIKLNLLNVDISILQ